MGIGYSKKNVPTALEIFGIKSKVVSDVKPAISFESLTKMAGVYHSSWAKADATRLLSAWEQYWGSFWKPVSPQREEMAKMYSTLSEGIKWKIDPNLSEEYKKRGEAIRSYDGEFLIAANEMLVTRPAQELLWDLFVGFGGRNIVPNASLCFFFREEIPIQGSLRFDLTFGSEISPLEGSEKVLLGKWCSMLFANRFLTMLVLLAETPLKANQWISQQEAGFSGGLTDIKTAIASLNHLAKLTDKLLW